MKNYYTLVTFQNGKWAPQFGDYEKNVVKDEQLEYKGKKQIICTDDNQKAIDLKIAELNSKV